MKGLPVFCTYAEVRQVNKTHENYCIIAIFFFGTAILSSCRNGENFVQQRYFPEQVFPIGITSNTDMFLMVTSDNRLWGHGWLSSYLAEPGIDVMRKYHPMPVHIMNDISYITGNQTS